MKTLQTVVATHNDAEGPEPVNTVLVAGGAGFLGSHLCERLLVEGRRVICVDNLLTGSIANIAAFLSNRNFSFLRHDIVLPFEPGSRSVKSTIWLAQRRRSATKRTPSTRCRRTSTER